MEQQCEVIEFLQRRCTNLAQALLRAQAQEDRRALHLASLGVLLMERSCLMPNGGAACSDRKGCKCWAPCSQRVCRLPAAAAEYHLQRPV